MNIPVNTPLLDGNEKKYLNECIESGWISSEGPFVKEFEEKFASRVNRKFGIAVCNGTVGLELAVKAIGINPGDEIILPSFTIISCAAAIVRAGAIPVLVDSDPLTWNMDVSKIEEKITSRTKAIMVVHTYGLPVDMDTVIAVANKHNLKIIEDAAEAHGLLYKGKPCGSFGDISVFSFYPNKHVTTGEGGMVLTNDPEISNLSKSLRNLCFLPERRFVHEDLGWNFRMNNLQAAVGLAQLERLDEFIDIKKSMGKLYNNALSGIDSIQNPLLQTSFAENIFWVYGLVLKNKDLKFRDELTKELAKRGIGTRPFFWCMHEQPILKKMGFFQNESYPVAEKMARCGFYIPSGLALQSHEIKYVSETLNLLLK